MRIRSLEIKNFRGVREASIDGFGRINFFVGNNNAGKTTLLEAIFLNIGIANPILAININKFRSLLQTTEDDFRFIFYNLDYKNIPTFKTVFDENDHQRSLEIKPKKRVGSSMALPKKKTLEFDAGESIYETQLDQNQISGLLFDFSIKEKHQRKKTYQSEIFFELASVSTNIPEDYREKLKGVFMFPTTQAPNLDKRIENLIVNKAHQPIVDTLKKIDNNIQDIVLGTNGMIYFDIGLDRLIPINLSGDGIRRVLSILVTIADIKNGIIIIDEIDNGLHFSSQGTLLKAIIEATKAYNVQVFATTHNYETLKTLKNVLDTEDYREHSSEIKAFTIRKSTENKLTAYPYNYDKLEYAIEQELEIR